MKPAISIFKQLSWVILGLALFLPRGTYAKTLTFNDQTWTLPPVAVTATTANYLRHDFSLLNLAQATLQGTSPTQTITLFDPGTLGVINQIQTAITQKPEDAQLQIQNSQATQFNPGQKGQSLDVRLLAQDLLTSKTDISLPIIVSEPTTTLAQTNTLGINELVATGISDFTGSPKNRLVNIRVGAAKFNGLIIAPGQEFSFNQYLGDVDAAHGFLPELVIKPEGVTPEFGGGLCQVSTTAFRAAMNAGLPITARRNHSFAVSYYSPQGTDATIYPGSADLKFVNNLSSSLLIQTQIIGKKLYFYYYGTKDDRQVSFEGPTVYDRMPDGSMKATWIRHVTFNGQTTTQTFNSNYLPPALFEHEATTAASTPNPEATTNNPPVTQ